MMNTQKFLSILAITALLFTSCSDDDDNPAAVSPEEVITTMTVTLTGGGDVVTMRFFDEDGEDGPTNPTSTVSGNLNANTTYTGTVVLLNETVAPAEEVNEEIEEEADEHQFFFLTDDLGITTAYSDQECDYNDDPCTGANANPVGLTFTLTTGGDTGDGELRVVLRHELDKDAQGVASGDITNAGGSPDIDWTFDFTVE